MRRSPLPLAAQNIEVRNGAFQSKSGSAQRSKSIQHFERFSTHWKRRKEIQKPWVFGGVLFPISSAVGRNGAAGGIKSDPRRGAEYPGNKSSGGAHWPRPTKCVRSYGVRAVQGVRSSGPSGTPAPLRGACPGECTRTGGGVRAHRPTGCVRSCGMVRCKKCVQAGRRGRRPLRVHVRENVRGRVAAGAKKERRRCVSLFYVTTSMAV